MRADRLFMWLSAEVNFLLWLGLTVILYSFCNDSILTGVASSPCTFEGKNAEVFFELGKKTGCAEMLFVPVIKKCSR